MALTIQESKFILPLTVSATGTTTNTLYTKDTYVDRDIEVQVTTPAGTISGGGAIYPYLVNSTTGWKLDNSISDDELTQLQNEKSPLLLKIGFTGGFGITHTDDTGATADGGFLSSDESNKQIGNLVKSLLDSTYKIVIPEATYANTATDGTTYTETAGPVLVSGDYLYLNAGYVSNVKIPLADLVPDAATVSEVNGDSQYIYKTVSVYDKDGKLIAGTMDDAVFDDFTLTSSKVINTPSIDYWNSQYAASSTNIKPAISGSDTLVDGFYINNSARGTINGTIGVKTTGLATAGNTQDVEVKDITVSVASTHLDTVTLALETSSDSAAFNKYYGWIEQTPVISADTASTNITLTSVTDKPTSGYYFAMGTAATDDIIKVAPKVQTAGYGTPEHYTAGTINQYHMKNKAATAYFTLPEANLTFTANEEDSSVSDCRINLTTSIKDSTDTAYTLSTTIPENAANYLQIISNYTVTDKGVTEVMTNYTLTEGYTKGINAGGMTATSDPVNVVLKDTPTTYYIKIYNGEAS